jgi:hypothetical protein
MELITIVVQSIMNYKLRDNCHDNKWIAHVRFQRKHLKNIRIALTSTIDRQWQTLQRADSILILSIRLVRRGLLSCVSTRGLILWSVHQCFHLFSF